MTRSVFLDPKQLADEKELQGEKWNQSVSLGRDLFVSLITNVCSSLRKRVQIRSS